MRSVCGSQVWIRGGFVSPVDFGTEPGDSNALERLRCAIDDHLPAYEPESEAGDYEGVVRKAADAVKRSDELARRVVDLEAERNHPACSEQKRPPLGADTDSLHRPNFLEGLHVALETWLQKLVRRARLDEDLVGESLKFSVRQDAEKDEDGAPYLHVTLTERTDTDCEGRVG